MRRRSNKCDTYKVIGLILIGIGVLVLLFSVPRWLWTSFIGIALIVAGIVCWRLG